MVILLQIGAVDIPIYPTMTENDYEYIFNHSESIIALFLMMNFMTK